jgi:hypothetical protein
LEHPECDIKVEAFLASAGTFFQNYLRKALGEITTCKMQACGMLKDTSLSNDKKISIKKLHTNSLLLPISLLSLFNFF